MFNRKTLINNIYHLAKQKNVKIGDLENDANVSNGYFSRLAKEDNSTVPSVETMYIVSTKLDVPLDVLIKYDLETIDDTEKYVVPFLETLINETSIDRISWQFEKFQKITTEWVENGQPLNSNHPLLIVEGDPDDFPDKRSLKYNSLFSNLHLSIDDKIFSFNNFNTRFYLVKLAYIMPGTIKRIFGHFYEMYAITNGKRKKICNAKVDSKSLLEKLMTTLYDAVTNYCNKPNLDKDVIEVIGNFMQSIKKVGNVDE